MSPHLEVHSTPVSHYVVLDRTLYLTADREELVEEGDRRAAFLFATAGKRVPLDEAVRYGLAAAPKSKSKPAPEPEPAPESAEEPEPDAEPEEKQADQPEDKQAAKPANKAAKKTVKRTRKAKG